MAKKDNNTEEAPEVEVAPVSDPSEIPTATVPEKTTRKGSGLGRIRVTHTESGKEFRRTDVIRNLWDTKQFSRTQIRQVLENEYGHETTYQVVFQATKGLEGGPVKAEKPAEEEVTAEDA